MQKKPQTNTELDNQIPTVPEDSAQESQILQEIAKTKLENIIEFYYKHSFKVFVALTKDYIKENQPKLFHGQIGEILFLPDKTTCWVKFYHYENEEKELIHQLRLPTVDLFPLFFKSPLFDKVDIKNKREEFSNTQDVYLEEKYKNKETKEEVILANHREGDNRVSINQIVTIGTDFVFTTNNNRVIICAGQVGRISKILKNGLVEVSFKSAFLTQLISEIENNGFEEMDSFDDWFEKIIIDKDYLFFLYYKNLDSLEDRLYYEDFQRTHIEDKKVRDEFDPNTYFYLDSCIKSDHCKDILDT